MAKLNPRGHTRTERALRTLYANGSPADREVIARYICTEWKSRRGVALAEEWIDGGARSDEYVWLFTRLAYGGMSMIDRFNRELDRDDLTDEERDYLLDRFSDLIDLRDRHPRYPEALARLASFADNPCPNIRFTVIFSLAKLYPGSAFYRDVIARACNDPERADAGWIAKLAKIARRQWDGESGVDLHEAFELTSLHEVASHQSSF